MTKRNVIYSGPSTLGLLGIAFIVLKLTGYIGWSWWWVTAPFWAPLALVISVFTLLVFLVMIAAIVLAICQRK